MTNQNIFNYIHRTVLGDSLLEKAQTIDTHANGIQIYGKDTVEKIAIGVSCNSKFLASATQWGADACIFHHGLCLNEKYIYNSRLDLPTQKQLRLIFEHNLTIAGYHYALDAHPQIGNNAMIIKKLEAKRLDIPYFDGWGWIGEFEQPVDIQDLATRCSKLFKHDVFMILGGPEKVQRIGVCSGAAKPNGASLFDLVDKNVDVHITGEITERGPSIAAETGFNYFACGHYATEVFGIQVLGEKIQEQFPDIEVRFIDVWNEL